MCSNDYRTKDKIKQYFYNGGKKRSNLLNERHDVLCFRLGAPEWAPAMLFKTLVPGVKGIYNSKLGAS